MVLYALPTLGAARLGTLPDPSQLSLVARVEAWDQPRDPSEGLEDHLTEQLKMAGDGEPGQPKATKPPQHFLAAPGLPTISSKLPPKIWDWSLWRWRSSFPRIGLSKPWISSHQNCCGMEYLEHFTNFSNNNNKAAGWLTS